MFNGAMLHVALRGTLEAGEAGRYAISVTVASLEGRSVYEMHCKNATTL